jgi:hypothetical protein
MRSMSGDPHRLGRTGARAKSTRNAISTTERCNMWLRERKVRRWPAMVERGRDR